MVKVSVRFINRIEKKLWKYLIPGISSVIGLSPQKYLASERY